MRSQTLSSPWSLHFSCENRKNKLFLTCEKYYQGTKERKKIENNMGTPNLGSWLGKVSENVTFSGKSKGSGAKSLTSWVITFHVMVAAWAKDHKARENLNYLKK